MKLVNARASCRCLAAIPIELSMTKRTSSTCLSLGLKATDFVPGQQVVEVGTPKVVAHCELTGARHSQTLLAGSQTSGATQIPGVTTQLSGLGPLKLVHNASQAVIQSTATA